MKNQGAIDMLRAVIRVLEVAPEQETIPEPDYKAMYEELAHGMAAEHNEEMRRIGREDTTASAETRRKLKAAEEEITALRRLINISLGMMDAPKYANLVDEVGKLVAKSEGGAA